MSGFGDILAIGASGMAAQRVRVQIASSNVANAEVTRGPDGQPYKRLEAMFESKSMDPFGDALSQAMNRVEVREIEANEDFRKVHDPGHPDADEFGYVTLPDINTMQEMTDLMTASRGYEANANVVDVTRELAQRAIDLGG